MRQVYTFTLTARVRVEADSDEEALEHALQEAKQLDIGSRLRLFDLRIAGRSVERWIAWGRRLARGAPEGGAGAPGGPPGQRSSPAPGAPRPGEPAAGP